MAAAFASLLISAGTFSCAANSSLRATLPSHGRLGGSSTMPVKGLAFGTPAPTPRSLNDLSFCSSSVTPSDSAATKPEAVGYCLVSRWPRALIFPSESTSPKSVFVPPMSMPSTSSFISSCLICQRGKSKRFKQGKEAWAIAWNSYFCPAINYGKE